MTRGPLEPLPKTSRRPLCVRCNGPREERLDHPLVRWLCVPCADRERVRLGLPLRKQLPLPGMG